MWPRAARWAKGIVVFSSILRPATKVVASALGSACIALSKAMAMSKCTILRSGRRVPRTQRGERQRCFGSIQRNQLLRTFYRCTGARRIPGQHVVGRCEKQQGPATQVSARPHQWHAVTDARHQDQRRRILTWALSSHLTASSPRHFAHATPRRTLSSPLVL